MLGPLPRGYAGKLVRGNPIIPLFVKLWNCRRERPRVSRYFVPGVEEFEHPLAHLRRWLSCLLRFREDGVEDCRLVHLRNVLPRPHTHPAPWVPECDLDYKLGYVCVHYC